MQTEGTENKGNNKPAPQKVKADHIADVGNRVVTVAVESHTHAGQAVSKGDKITVTPDERDWLAKHHLIEV